jgi:Dolichyl-phosphate-mannose-protein mannosyltransferase
MAAPESRGARPRPVAYALVAAVAALPRLAVLLYERSEITSAYVDKSADFARTFVRSGTFGFIPDHPSAYTQPLYGFFLVPLYWIFDRSWLTVGIAQLVVAALTAILVYEIGRRFLSPTVGVTAAVATTLEPYLIWHDVHMNREILDQLLAAALVLLALLVVERPSLQPAAALGAVSGLALLGNVRLLLLPLLLAGLVVAFRHDAVLPAAAIVVVAGVLVTPWLVRNTVSVGCFTLTTDARALWKANNAATLRTLENGKWIDDVPGIPGSPPTPQDAGDIYRETGRVVSTDECAQMRFYRRRALDFVVDHPGEKAKLAGVAARMLWQPSVTRTEGRRGKGTFLDTARSWIEPAYMVVLYVLAAIGFFLLPRVLRTLALVLLAYDTLTAMVFAGETRYRIPWDFLIALAAGTALVELVSRIGASRAPVRVEP